MQPDLLSQLLIQLGREGQSVAGQPELTSKPTRRSDQDRRTEYSELKQVIR